MKNILKKMIYFMFVFFAVGVVSISAKELDDFPNRTYIIGTHEFVPGTSMSAQRIMLASKTIEGNTLDDMIIYYKDSEGDWINAITSALIDEEDLPEFNIQYKNLIFQFTFAPYTAAVEDITEISEDGIEFDGDEFKIPLGIVEFTFEDNEVKKAAIREDDVWGIVNYGELESALQTAISEAEGLINDAEDALVAIKFYLPSNSPTITDMEALVEDLDELIDGEVPTTASGIIALTDDILEINGELEEKIEYMEALTDRFAANIAASSKISEANTALNNYKTIVNGLETDEIYTELLAAKTALNTAKDSPYPETASELEIITEDIISKTTALNTKISEMNSEISTKLANAKIDAKDDLDDAYTSTDYSLENQAIIEGYISAGDTAIDAATTINAINSAKSTALDNIGSVKTIAQEYDDFKTTHSAALALTVETVTVDDKGIVETALEDYDELSDEAKSLAGDDKNLLDALLLEIQNLED